MQDDEAVRNELVRTVRAAVAELRPRFRMPLILRYLAGLSYEEVAAVLGVSPGTVASRLHRAHRQLGRKLHHLRGHVSKG